MRKLVRALPLNRWIHISSTLKCSLCDDPLLLPQVSVKRNRVWRHYHHGCRPDRTLRGK